MQRPHNLKSIYRFPPLPHSSLPQRPLPSYPFQVWSRRISKTTRPIITIKIPVSSPHLSQGTPPDGLIIDAGFTNMSDASRAHPIGAPFLSLPLLKQLVNERVGKLWLSTKHLLEVRCPILIFHGKRDIILPHLFGRTLYETFSSIGHGLYCKYVEIEKAGHNNIYRFQEWVHELEHFFLSRESSISSSSNSAPPFRGKPRSLKEKGGVK